MVNGRRRFAFYSAAVSFSSLFALPIAFAACPPPVAGCPVPLPNDVEICLSDVSGVPELQYPPVGSAIPDNVYITGQVTFNPTTPKITITAKKQILIVGALLLQDTQTLVLNAPAVDQTYCLNPATANGPSIRDGGVIDLRGSSFIGRNSTPYPVLQIAGSGNVALGDSTKYSIIVSHLLGETIISNDRISTGVKRMKRILR